MPDTRALEGYELLDEPRADGLGLRTARRVADGVRVTIKLLPEGLPPIPLARLNREARALASLDSRHLIRCLEAHLDSPRPWLVLPWIEGASLARHLEDARRGGDSSSHFPLPHTFEWSRQLAAGLGAAHGKGMVIGGLEPAHVLLPGEEHLVIADLDLARAEEVDLGALDHASEAMTAYRYFAPEQYTGRKVTSCTDIYRWALIVHEMLTGSLPHESGQLIVDLRLRCEKPPPPLSFREPRLDGLARLVRRCLDPEPMLREMDGSSLLDALDALVDPGAGGVAGTGAGAPARPDDPSLPRDTLVGGYAITGKLGEGGMGIVYEGTHPTSGQRAAIKVLNPRIATNSQALRRFRREVKLLVNMASRRLVKALGFGDLPQGPYVIMEHIPGRALSEILEREGALSPRAAMILFTDLAEGLRDLHAKNVLHRDLKPANLLVDVSGRGHILDLGIAKDLEASPLTATGTPLGTPGYLSPEMSRHEKVGPPADVFQAGLILYEMLTGRKDGRAPEAADSLRAALGAHPGLQSTAGLAWIESVVSLFLRACEPDPRRRHKGGAELLAESRRIRSELEVDEGLAPAVLDPPSSGAVPIGAARARLPRPPATEAPLIGACEAARPASRSWGILLVLAVLAALASFWLYQSSST